VNCLDAETLAAWVDGGLKGAALEDVRSHVAGCDRCQMLLGAMGRTRAAVPSPEPERSPRRWLAWAVPLTAAATAIAIWIAVPKPSSAPVPSPAAVSVAPPAASPSLDTLTSATAKEQAASAQVSRDAKQGAPPPVAREASDADRLAARNDELLRDAARPEADAREQRALRAPAAAAPAAPPPEAAAGAAAQSANVLAERVQLAPRCGAAWSAAMPAAESELTAGSAPATGICWVVGRGGAVWRSVDGRTWQRVTFPEITDLSAVMATDARSASVSSADGRTFRTSDGGVTWMQQ
jgi:hypothetical protein